MKAQDFQDQNNNRAEAIRMITAFCDAAGFSYTYTEKKFNITLPIVEPIPITNAAIKRIYGPEWSLSPDPKGVDETLPDELPPVDTTLNEGEAPE